MKWFRRIDGIYYCAFCPFNTRSLDGMFAHMRAEKRKRNRLGKGQYKLDGTLLDKGGNGI